ncbi:MAG: universal stress protein [Mycobacteriaceae bacterium]
MSDENDVGGAEQELIVVGVDGSEPSRQALRWPAQQAERSTATLVAVIAWEPLEVFGSMTPPTALAADFSADAGNVLEHTVKSVLGSQPPVPVTIEVVQGRPALILDQASHRADLLVVGNRGHGALEEVLLGSVSLHCVFHAACPVVVVRPRRSLDTRPA